MRAGDVHEHVAERSRYALGVAVAVAVLAARLGIAFVGAWFVMTSISSFSAVRGKIGDRPIDRLFFHLRNFLHRQLGLACGWAKSLPCSP